MKVKSFSAIIAVLHFRKYDLDSHIRKHNSSTIPESIQCQECEKTFSGNHNLKRHVDVIHGGIKYKCQQCPKEYTSNENLKIHVRNTHEGYGFPAINAVLDFPKSTV